jgi:hypothetical protein
VESRLKKKKDKKVEGDYLGRRRGQQEGKEGQEKVMGGEYDQSML